MEKLIESYGTALPEMVTVARKVKNQLEYLATGADKSTPKTATI
jgi:hypothetical protein